MGYDANPERARPARRRCSRRRSRRSPTRCAPSSAQLAERRRGVRRHRDAVLAARRRGWPRTSSARRTTRAWRCTCAASRSRARASTPDFLELLTTRARALRHPRRSSTPRALERAVLRLYATRTTLPTAQPRDRGAPAPVDRPRRARRDVRAPARARASRSTRSRCCAAPCRRASRTSRRRRASCCSSGRAAPRPTSRARAALELRHTLVEPPDPARARARARASRRASPLDEARRIELWRLAKFELERARRRRASTGIHAFYGVSRDDNRDERHLLLRRGRRRRPRRAATRPTWRCSRSASTRRSRRCARVQGAARPRPPAAVEPAVPVRAPADRALEPAAAPRRCAGSRPRRVTSGSRRSSCAWRASSATRRTPPRKIELLAGNPTGSRVEWSLRVPHDRPLDPATPYAQRVATRARARAHLPVRDRAPVHRAAGARRGRHRSSRRARAASASTTSSTARAVAGRPRAGPEPRGRRVRRDLDADARSTPRACERVLDPGRPDAATWARSPRASATASSRRSISPSASGCPSSGSPLSRRRAHRDGQRHREPRRHRARRAPARHVHRRRRRGEPDPPGAERRRAELLRRARHHGAALARHPDHAAERVRWCSPAARRSSSRAAVAAEDEIGIGGYERIMGPNGEAQFQARDLGRRLRDPARALRAAATSRPARRRRAASRRSDSPERDVMLVAVRGRGGLQDARRDVLRRGQPGPQAAVRDARR